jgi:4-azaleucine resistance transporter AzlC
MPPAARSEFLAGVRATLPILVGVIPFGLIYGVSAIAAGLSAPVSQSMSVVVFAGSAQFVITQLIARGTPAAVIIVTAVIVNLRHVLYSASIAPYLKNLSPLWKWGLAYFLIDESYATTIVHYQQSEQSEQTAAEKAHSPAPHQYKQWYLLGSGLALWTLWQVSTAVGVFLGTQIPSAWSLDFAIALTFIALVVPLLRDRAGVLAALVSGIVAVAMVGVLPYMLELVVATLIGIGVGFLAMRISGARKKATSE